MSDSGARAITLAGLAVDAARIAGRIEGLVHGLTAGATTPHQLIEDIAAEAEKLAELAERAVAAPTR